MIQKSSTSNEADEDEGRTHYVSTAELRLTILFIFNESAGYVLDQYTGENAITISQRPM